MPAPERPAIEVTDRAREALQGFLTREGKSPQYIRIHVGRGWGGWSYHLSLDETADPDRDVVIEANGIRFVAEQHQRHLVPGLRIEVQQVFGREGLVAYNAGFEPGGC